MKLLNFLTSVFFFLLVFTSFSQSRISPEFGIITDEDLQFKVFEDEPEAAGVVLFESGKNYIKYTKGDILLIKEVHRKIKVLNAKKFNKSEVDIYFYKSEASQENVKNIIAITHNGIEKTMVESKDIYSIDKTTKWGIKRFTFPNIKDGSILEYKYKIVSPFFFNFGAWDFQNTLPTIYSEFTTSIPGNYIYRTALIGGKRLDLHESKIVKRCFHVPNISKKSSCVSSLYAMFNSPSFKKEDYMLSHRNYIYSVDYELQEIINFDGIKHKYSKEWKDVDKEFKNDESIGKQLKAINFFKKKLPEDILAIKDTIYKAKAVFSFIQNHYTWDGSYRIFSDVFVKNAFKNKKGNIAEINISLINALQASGLEAKLVLLATRDQKVPTKIYPILTEFNYLVAIIKINNKNYLLDASNKLSPFGIIPFKALNVRGRVMDFKKGSYWMNLKPYQKNVSYKNIQLSQNIDGSFNGEVTEAFTGYSAIKTREKILNNSEKEYLISKFNSQENIEIDNYSSENKNKIEQTLKEKYSVTYEPELVSGKTIIYPFFLISNFKENPFKLENRNFDIDFGYPFEETNITSIQLSKNYSVINLPKSRMFKLPNEAGECSIIYNVDKNKINLKYQLKLKKSYISSEVYLILKDFFSEIVKVLNNEPILIKKK